MNITVDPREHLVVIGNGMAGMRTVEELLKRGGAGRFRITVFGAEPHGNYNRILLSSVLAGDKTMDDIVINSRAWYAQNGITLVAGDAVTAIDRGGRTGEQRLAPNCECPPLQECFTGLDCATRSFGEQFNRRTQCRNVIRAIGPILWFQPCQQAVPGARRRKRGICRQDARPTFGQDLERRRVPTQCGEAL